MCTTEERLSCAFRMTRGWVNYILTHSLALGRKLMKFSNFLNMCKCRVKLPNEIFFNSWHIPLQLNDSLVLLKTFRLLLLQKSQQSLYFSIRLLHFLFMTDSYCFDNLQLLCQFRVPASNMFSFTRLPSKKKNNSGSTRFMYLYHGKSIHVFWNLPY